MKSTLKVDTSGLNRRIAELRTALVGAGKTADAQNVIRDEARNLLKLLIKWTPPKTRKQGADRVEKDVKRSAAYPLDDGFELFNRGQNAERIKGYLRSESGRQKFKDMISKIGGFKSWTLEKFDRRTHLNARNRFGRVSKRNRVFIYNNADRKRRIALVSRRVGMMKAAWAKSFVHFGGKVPSWISRHLYSGAIGSYNVRGNFRDALSNTSKPFVEFSNSANGIAEKDAAKRLPGAVLVRERAIRRRIRLILSGYSKDVAQGIRIRQRTRDKSGSDLAE